MSSSSGHILLVEDHPVNQRVATAMLEHLGFDVDVVADGREAVNAATRRPYRAILMDCQIPVLDGYQATAEIRRLQGDARHTPIIAVTGSGQTSDEQRCREAGMDDYLTKPLTLKALAVVLVRRAPRGFDATIPGGREDEVPDGAPAPVADGAQPALDSTIVDRLVRLGKTAGEDLMSQLAMLFLADADTRLLALRRAVAGGERAAVVFSAHALSGASANLGATNLARLCATLETQGGQSDSAGQLAAIETELGRVRNALSLLTARS